jgi:hypothetical protein
VKTALLAGLLSALLLDGAFAATIKVTNTNDSGTGTLREALASATDGDTIDATGVSGTIFLTNGMLVVTNSITILGPGADVLAVDGNAAWCATNYPCSIWDSRVFLIGPVNVTIAGLTLTNGWAYADYGGCIYSAGATLTVSNCTITGNSAWIGAGIFIDGSSFGSATLTVVNSTFTGNSANGLGGGIFNYHSTLIVSNCTFSGNGAGFSGGGIYNYGLDDGPPATLSVSASTFAAAGDGIRNSSLGIDSVKVSVSACTFSSNGIDNSASSATVATSTFSGGGGIQNSSLFGDAMLWVSACTFSDGSGIGNSGTLEIGDTILNGSNTLSNSGTVISHGYNISSDSGGGVLTNTTDQINTEPFLGPLQDNGGPTFTHALLCGSPAIDAGKRDAIPALALDTDQRGFPRPVGSPAVAGGDGSDIGAFEVQPTNVCAIRCPYDITSNTAPDMCGATVTFDVCSSGSCPPIVATPASGSFFNTGTTPVTVTTNGVTVCTFNITVNDTQPPTITCPADIITNVGPAITSAVVTFSDPAAGDNCGLASAGCSPPSGSEFGRGTNTVIAIAVDTAGNTSSCTFNVIVLHAPPGPCPDLTSTWIDFVQTCKPINAGLQCKLFGELIVQNIGNANAHPSSVRYYLSSDGVQTNTLLKKLSTGTVKPGQPKRKKMRVKFPVGVNGSGQFIMAVLDAGGAVTECDEANNVVVFGPLP